MRAVASELQVAITTSGLFGLLVYLVKELLQHRRSMTDREILRSAVEKAQASNHPYEITLGETPKLTVHEPIATRDSGERRLPSAISEAS
jgi:hypothetical protein